MSLKSKFDNLKAQHEAGGRYVKKFGQKEKVFERFSEKKMAEIQDYMERMLLAYNPKEYVANGNMICGKPIKNGVNCETVLVTKGDKVIQGTNYIACPGCGKTTKLDVYPDRPLKSSNPQILKSS